jgi:hypothetical protein
VGFKQGVADLLLAPGAVDLGAGNAAKSFAGSILTLKRDEKPVMREIFIRNNAA